MDARLNRPTRNGGKRSDCLDAILVLLQRRALEPFLVSQLQRKRKKEQQQRRRQRQKKWRVHARAMRLVQGVGASAEKWAQQMKEMCVWEIEMEEEEDCPCSLRSPRQAAAGSPLSSLDSALLLGFASFWVIQSLRVWVTVAMAAAESEAAPEDSFRRGYCRERSSSCETKDRALRAESGEKGRERGQRKKRKRRRREERKKRRKVRRSLYPLPPCACRSSVRSHRFFSSF